MLRLFLTISLLTLLSGCTQTTPPERSTFDIPEDAEIVTDIKPGQHGGVFVLAMVNPPKTFNELISTDNYSNAAIRPFSAGLLNLDRVKDEIIPGLAKSWDISNDKRIYTFHLRKGIRWSDGHPFTADDYIFTLDAIFDKRYPNSYQNQLTIEGEPIQYKKLDDYTIEISTKKPYAPLLQDVAVSILPKHKLYKYYQDGTLLKKWSLDTALETPEELVGLGPFIVHQYIPGERLIFKPNPHYWRVDEQGKRLPYINFLIHKYVPDVNTQMVLFSTGQLDASVIAPKDLPWIREAAKTYHINIHNQGPTDGVAFFWFNMHPGKNADGKPYVDPIKFRWFTNKKFRQALAYALDLDNLINSLYNGQGESSYTIIKNANKKWFKPDIKKYPLDINKAKSLLINEGFKYNKKGQLLDRYNNRVTFELLGTEGSSSDTYTTIQQSLKKIGIKVILSFVDFGTLLERTSSTFSYDAAVMGFGGGSSEPSSGKSILLSSGHMHVWYPEQPKPATPWEAKVDRLFELQQSELDFEKRRSYIYQIQDIYAEELPLIYLTIPNAFTGIKECWSNIKVPSMGSLLWNLDELWTCNPQNYYR